MLIKFTKMHGLGNDFVVLDLISQRFNLRPGQVRAMADRKHGIGCDQVLVVEAPRNPDVDFKYRIYNADGDEVEQCGNGARCFARFVRDQRLTSKTRIAVETCNGILTLEVCDDGQVRVDMGIPGLDPESIPMQVNARADHYLLPLIDRELSVGAVSIGNPHAVTVVESTETAPVAELGPLIENHPLFPQRANAGFMQILTPGEINLRVFERGVGETLACGSGACAAVVVGRLQQLLDEQVTVHLRGGPLQIAWAGEGHPVIMTGPASKVFEGSIRL